MTMILQRLGETSTHTHNTHPPNTLNTCCL